MQRRKILWILAGVPALLLGLVVVAYAGLVAINWNDETPSAEAERLAAIYRDRPALADTDNGRVQMERLAAGAEDYRSARGPDLAALAKACTEPARCETALDASPDALAQWLDSERWLVDRYRNALAATGWREDIPGDGTLPALAFQPVLDAQKLHLLEAVQLARAGDAAAVGDLLERDLVFWRGVLASSDLLITKMIAVSAVGRNFQFGSLALRSLPADLVEAAIPQAWRSPLTLPERSLVRAYAGEWHFSAGVLRSGLSGAMHDQRGTLGEWLGRPLLQEQATLNLFARRMSRLGAVSELPCPELARALDSLLEEPAPPAYRLYNPMGTSLDAIAVPTLYTDYITRANDLEGHRRVALLAATLRAKGIAAADADAAVRRATLRNPCDGTALEWDAASGAVVFQGLTRGDRGRYVAPL